MNNKSNEYMTPEKMRHHAEIFCNRVKKRYAHLRKRYARWNIDCYRLYDWDIPEVRAVVDWYAGHLVVAEYVRKQTGPDWLPTMAKALGEAMNIPAEKIHVKQRQTRVDSGSRYKRLDFTENRFEVCERDLKFLVNCNDFLDTGLYSDHRDTRVIVRDLAKDQDFLNLFAYTGAFTCAAAAGGAATCVTVDRSDTYLQWAQANLELNGLWSARQELVQSDVADFLSKAKGQGRRFSLAFVDPPSFFRDDKRGVAFDINREHPKLLKAVFDVMNPGGEVFFSTNHQGFQPKFEALEYTGIIELTPKTVPEDYRNQKIHRCWRMQIGPKS